MLAVCCQLWFFVQNSVKEISKILCPLIMPTVISYCASLSSLSVIFSTITDTVNVSVTSTIVIVTCTKFGIFDIIALASDFSHVDACGF